MELGKHGKLKGQAHPRDLRKTDPEPPRATPKVKPKRKSPGLFGFSYEYRQWWWSPKKARWIREFKWFEKEASRDQSMRAFERSIKDIGDTYRDVRPESAQQQSEKS